MLAGTQPAPPLHVIFRPGAQKRQRRSLLAGGASEWLAISLFAERGGANQDMRSHSGAKYSAPLCARVSLTSQTVERSPPFLLDICTPFSRRARPPPEAGQRAWRPPVLFRWPVLRRTFNFALCAFVCRRPGASMRALRALLATNNSPQSSRGRRKSQGRLGGLQTNAPSGRAHRSLGRAPPLSGYPELMEAALRRCRTLGARAAVEWHSRRGARFMHESDEEKRRPLSRRCRRCRRWEGARVRPTPGLTRSAPAPLGAPRAARTERRWRQWRSASTLSIIESADKEGAQVASCCDRARQTGRPHGARCLVTPWL